MVASGDISSKPLDSHTRVMILSDKLDPFMPLQRELVADGINCCLSSDEQDIWNVDEPLDLLVVDAEKYLDEFRLQLKVRRLNKERQVPVIVIVGKKTVSVVDNLVDDFVFQDCTMEELSLRVKRVLEKRSGAEEPVECLKPDQLYVDFSKREVTIGSKVVDLTFTEYELLRLLISYDGRVLTRQVLLHELWGEDYSGSSRTVDVHIRRLRAKIEHGTNTFVETVRNIGYRFRRNT